MVWPYITLLFMNAILQNGLAIHHSFVYECNITEWFGHTSLLSWQVVQ